MIVGVFFAARVAKATAYFAEATKAKKALRVEFFLGRVMDDTLHLAGVVDAWVTLGFLAFFAAMVAKALPLG